MTPTNEPACPVCGYGRTAPACTVCSGAGVTLGRRRVLVVGQGNPLLQVLAGIDDVRRAVSTLLFAREFVGALRGPVAVNMAAMLAMAVLGWTYLLPAFESVFAAPGDSRAHLWLFAVWLGLGPALLDLLAGWAMGPIRRATERYMLDAAPPAHRGPSMRERLVLLALGGVGATMMLGLVLVPWVGLLSCALLGSILAAIVYMQAPMAARGGTLRTRLSQLAAQPWRALGAGLGLQVAACVPFLNVLALLPVAAITATSTYLHMHKQAAGGGQGGNDASGRVHQSAP